MAFLYGNIQNAFGIKIGSTQTALRSMRNG